MTATCYYGLYIFPIMCTFSISISILAAYHMQSPDERAGRRAFRQQAAGQTEIETTHCPKAIHLLSQDGWWFAHLTNLMQEFASSDICKGQTFWLNEVSLGHCQTGMNWRIQVFPKDTWLQTRVALGLWMQVPGRILLSFMKAILTHLHAASLQTLPYLLSLPQASPPQAYMSLELT